MKILNLTPAENGAYSAIQEWQLDTAPKGYGEIDDALDLSVFYESLGFVKLVTKTVVVHEDSEGEPETKTIITGMATNKAALDAWKEAHPPVEPEPTEAERIEALEAAVEMLFMPDVEE